MDVVQWQRRPHLRRPVLLAAFEGWNDAADAASGALAHLAEAWGARPFATIDPEDFYDFTTVRPTVRLHDGITRTIEWPAPELSAAAIPGTGRDAVFLAAAEPGLRWRTFCQTILGIVNELDVELALTLGALLAGVPHTRPVQVIGTAVDADLVDRLGLHRSRYEGPTGILGVLTDAFRQAGIPAASLWASVPYYLQRTPSPRAMLALVERTAGLLQTTAATADLELAAAEYDRQVDETMSSDPEVAEHVRRLEEELAEEEGERPIPTADELAADVERYLRGLGGSD